MVKRADMTAEESLRSKALYKIELYLLKIIPMLLSVNAISNTILSYYDIDVAIFSYIGGISLLPLIFLYISSYVFKFCAYHRMFLHYILLSDLISIYDYHVGFDVNDSEYLCIHLTITGICLFLVLYLYLNRKR